MIVVGMDTDAKGSVAILDCRNRSKPLLDVYAIPNRYNQLKSGSKRIEIVFPALVAIMVELISSVPVDKVYLEEQWSRPKQGVASTFGFGRTFGDCRSATAAGLLASGVRLDDVESRIVFVPGADWKPAMRLDNDKSRAIALANSVFPNCAHAWKKTSLHTSAAEASLLALYGATQEGVRIPPGSVVMPPERPILTVADSLVLTQSLNPKKRRTRR